VHVWLVPLADPSRNIKFRLDRKEGSISADGKMPDADWEVAREYALDPANLALIEWRRQLARAWGLASSGRRLKAEDRTYAFEEFSPIREDFLLHFKFGAERWFAVDTYCANPDCSCVEAHLPLYRIRPERRKQDAEFVVALDLQTGEIRKEPDGTFPPDWLDVVRAFQDSLGDWRRELSRRREALRAIALKRLRRPAAEVAPVVASPLAAAQARPSEASAGSQAPRVPLRAAGGDVSRNAPCPCGSGKKFKRCCGAR